MDPAIVESLFDKLHPHPDGLVLYVVPSDLKTYGHSASHPIACGQFYWQSRTPHWRFPDVALDLRTISLLRHEDDIAGDPVALAELALRESAYDNILANRIGDLVNPMGRCLLLEESRSSRVVGQRNLRSCYQKSATESMAEVP